MTSALSSQLNRFQGTSFIIGAVGIVLAIILGFATGSTDFFQSYLYAFLFLARLSFRLPTPFIHPALSGWFLGSNDTQTLRGWINACYSHDGALHSSAFRH